MFNIPIELFIFGITLSLIFVGLGLIKNKNGYRSHWMIITSGFFIAIFALNTDNIVMGERIDNIVATPETFNITSNNVDIRIYPYSVISNSANGEIDNSPSVRAEFISSTSSLIGDTFQCITIPMNLFGSPASNLGIVVGFYDGGGLLIQQIGNTLSITQLTATFQYFDFCLPDGTLHTFALNDRIGIGFNQSTTAGNGINLRIDDTNPFDSTDTYRQSYIGSWSSVTNGDMTFGMYRTEAFPTNVQVAGIGGIYSYEERLHEFTELEKTIFLLIGGFICICSVFLMRSEE